MNCQLCNKPLGQESQDLGFKTCHDCRRCVSCQEPLLPCESNYCLDNKLVQKHSRCVTESDLHIIEGMGLQPVVDLLNMSRLLTSTTADLEKIRSLDRTFEWLRMLQAEAAKVSVLVRMDKKALSELLNTERNSQSKAKANDEKLTSSRPTAKAASDPDEKAVGWFMQTYGIKERSTALKEIKNRDKAIKQLTEQLKIPYEQALTLVTEQFDKRFRRKAD